MESSLSSTTVRTPLKPAACILFTPFYSLYCRAVSVTESLFTKQGNPSIFGSKIRGLLLKAVSNQERVMMTRVRYVT